MNRLRRALSGASRDFYEADTRLLAIFRIAFGTLLLGYTLFVPVGHRLDAYFTDAGLYPLDLLAVDYPAGHRHTLFQFAHDRETALLIFGLTAVVDLLFALGVFTRFTGPLAVLLTISLHHRVPFVVNGSMLTMHLLGLWSVLLPLGRHASFDAWLARRRGRPTHPLRVRSFAVLALRLQLFAIYYFNVVHKTGDTWRDGTAVHYVLWQQRAALPTAILLREHEPAWFSQVASYGTLVIEALIALLLVLPVFRTKARRIGAVLILFLHTAFATMLDLGPFPFVFACAAILFLASDDGQFLPAWLGGGVPAVDERNDAPHPFVRRVRETVLVLFGIHAFFCVWDGNPAMRFVLGPAWLPAPVVAVRDALFLNQGWSLFAPNAPTGDVVIMPVVVLADGRHVDVRRRRPPDFDIADGRYLEPNFFDQTFDARLVTQPNPGRSRAFADYVARVPMLERWEGERRARAVLVHVLSGPRPAPGAPPTPLPRSEVPIMVDYPDGAPPVRR